MPGGAEALAGLAEPGAEGWRIRVESTSPLRVTVCGADDRGCLFGAGWLLRKLCLTPGRLEASDDLADCSVTPRYGLRGHQLAYRDKQNTCPNWTVEDFDAYIRTLALFGSNAIEILPPRTDDRLFSPLFRLHPMEMMTRLSDIIHGYGWTFGCGTPAWARITPIRPPSPRKSRNGSASLPRFPGWTRS
jgi:hypothetical protein